MIKLLDILRAGAYTLISVHDEGEYEVDNATQDRDEDQDALPSDKRAQALRHTPARP